MTKRGIILRIQSEGRGLRLYHVIRIRNVDIFAQLLWLLLLMLIILAALVLQLLCLMPF